MTRLIGFLIFVLASVLAFVSEFTAASIPLLFIVGLVAAGLACVTLDPAWRAGP